MAPKSHKQRKLWTQRAKALAEANHRTEDGHIHLPKVSRFGGFSGTNSDTTTTQIMLRRAGIQRGRTRKPTMPKMPWDTPKADGE